jgi:hypothetical protein
MGRNVNIFSFDASQRSGSPQDATLIGKIMTIKRLLKNNKHLVFQKATDVYVGSRFRRGRGGAVCVISGIRWLISMSALV